MSSVGRGSRARDYTDLRRDVWRGAGSTYYNPGGYYGGYSNWYGHQASLSFCYGYAPSWCNWGLYSYPYYYCSSWPSWYYGNRWSFGFYWNSCYPWWGYSSCWWPTTYYQPVVYTSYRYWDEGYGGGAYYPTSYGGGAVTIYEGESASTGDEDIVVGSRPAPASAASLAEHHVSLGDFYFKEERFQEAAESYLRALAYAPEDATIHFVLADALFAVGDYHYAAFMISKGTRLDPALASSDADKRTFYTNVETFEKQLQTLTDYVADKPYDGAAQLVLGYNLRFSGQPEPAEKAFRRVLEIEPSNETAATFLAAMGAVTESPAPKKNPEPLPKKK